jgi:hypothetical protein
MAEAAWKFREVLDCGSPLPLCVASHAWEKRQRAAAVQDAGARFGHTIPFGELFGLARQDGSGKIRSWPERWQTSCAKWQHNFFTVTGVTDCLLLELGNIGCG